MIVEGSAGSLIVRQLVELGADLAFGVPGESYLAVLDAVIDSPLRYVTCRQEGGAGYAAEAHAKLTGRPGVLMVTRGPGVTNAAVAVHTAQQDESPLLVLVGLIPSANRGRDAFQEIDLGRTFGSMAKWVGQLDDAEGAPELLARAWSIATAGRPGPVVVGLPEDRLEATASATILPRVRVAPPAPAPAELAELRRLLAVSERPMVVAGGSRWTEAAIAALPGAFPGVPLAVGFRRQDLVDHRIDQYAGSLGLGADPALVQRVADSDLLIAIGDRLDDPSTEGFTLLARRSGPFVHVHPEPRELGRVHRADLAITAAPETFLDAIAAAGPVLRTEWHEWCRDARDGWSAWSAGGGDAEAIVRGLREVLDEDAIVTHGAGNFTRPVQRAFVYRRPGRQLAPISGSMGYGLPAALAAAVTHPERQVVCVAGDGDLMMTAQELATIAHVGAHVTVLVMNNSRYGTIETHQRRRYPGREIATQLTNPDFVRLGEAFGATATRTGSVDEAVAALATGVRGRGLHLVEYVT